MGVLSPIRPATLTLGLSYADRSASEDEIERLVDMLDMFDGDCDLEDDREDDPLDRGECPGAEGVELMATLPIYGVDQTLGPVNEREAYRAWHRKMLAEF